jgi:pimeloyl-ACP methyl ester carboxylesterase
MTDSPTPVIFIHGLWLHPLSWTPWTDLFASAGYRAIAPGWPGVPASVEAARANPESIANHGIDGVSTHYAAIIEDLPRKPILIGHSFGGMIAEKLLGQSLAAAAIAIDAAQIKGVLPLPLSSLRSTLPVFRDPANKHLAVSLTAEQFRYSFGNAVDAGESDDLYRRWGRAGPCSRRLRPTFPCTLRRRSTRPMTTAAPCCSSWAAWTTPSPRPSPNPRSGSTATRRRRLTWSNSRTAGTR